MSATNRAVLPRLTFAIASTTLASFVPSAAAAHEFSTTSARPLSTLVLDEKLAWLGNGTVLPSTSSSPTTSMSTTSAVPEPASHTQRNIGIITLGAGIVITGVFGTLLVVENHKAKNDGCDGPAAYCAENKDKLNPAQILSTTMVVIGAAAIATGIVLWITAPSTSTPTKPTVGFSPGSARSRCTAPSEGVRTR